MDTDAGFDFPSLIAQLHQKYRKRNLGADFAYDGPAYTQFLPKIVSFWNSLGLELKKLIDVGTSASVWQVHDKHLNRDKIGRAHV